MRVYSEENMAAWPKCVVPGCSNHVFHGGGSDKCYPHTFYMTQEEIDAPPPADTKAWNKRHAMLVERKRQMESNAVIN